MILIEALQECYRSAALQLQEWDISRVVLVVIGPSLGVESLTTTYSQKHQPELGIKRKLIRYVNNHCPTAKTDEEILGKQLFKWILFRALMPGLLEEPTWS